MTLDEVMIAKGWLENKYPDWSIDIKEDWSGFGVYASNKGTKLDKLALTMTTCTDWIVHDRNCPKFSISLYINHQLMINVTGNMVTEALGTMQSRFKCLASAFLPKGALVALAEDFEELCLT